MGSVWSDNGWQFDKLAGFFSSLFAFNEFPTTVGDSLPLPENR